VQVGRYLLEVVGELLSLLGKTPQIAADAEHTPRASEHHGPDFRLLVAAHHGAQ
jgi:hypothetical protein